MYEEQSGPRHNGRPCYRKGSDDNYMLWSYKHAGTDVWIFGNAVNVGGPSGRIYLVSSDPLEQARGTWMTAGMVQAPDLRVLCEAAPDVQETGGRTRKQKDVELRKHAVDLEHDTPRKRSRQQTEKLEERVAKARSTTNGAIKRRMKELATAATNEYLEDKIDAAELDRRKEAARVQATADNQQRTALDTAFDTYTAAGQAREAACKAQATTADVEEAAEAALYKVLQQLEAGPSGSVKAEQ